jgi:chromosome segregation ATPase
MTLSGRFIVVSALLVCASAVATNMEVAISSSLTFDEQAAKNRPVSKVITLLKDMGKQLEKEAQDDEDVYDKMACWCETNDKEKTKSIADAEARVSDLTTKIEEHTANSARLNTEIKNLEEEVAKNQDALDKATAIRQKELEEFNAEEKDLLQSISALKSSVTVLSKHNGASALLQIPSSHIAGIAGALLSPISSMPVQSALTWTRPRSLS